MKKSWGLKITKVKPNDAIIHTGIWSFWLAGLYIGLRYIVADRSSLVFVLWVIWMSCMSFFWLVSVVDLIKTLLAKLVKKRDFNSNIRDNE